eukprot:4423950-Heterocapsa_arctica.AAC.1
MEKVLCVLGSQALRSSDRGAHLREQRASDIGVVAHRRRRGDGRRKVLVRRRTAQATRPARTTRTT